MTDAAPRAGRVLPFRRRQYVARRRRRNPWLAAVRALLAASSILAVPLSLAAWVWTSPRFQLGRLEVSGCERVAEDWVRAQLRPLLGRRLLTLDLDEIDGRLSAHRWIEAAATQKELPDGLRVIVRERRPAALLRTTEGLRYLAADGTIIAAWEPQDGDPGLPLVYGGGDRSTRASAVAVARRFEELAPMWGRGLSEVQALGPEEFRIYSAGLDFPLLVHGDRLDRGLDELARWMPAIRRRFGTVDAVDLRYDGQIIVQSGATAALPRLPGSQTDDQTG